MFTKRLNGVEQLERKDLFAGLLGGSFDNDEELGGSFDNDDGRLLPQPSALIASGGMKNDAQTSI